MKVRFKRETHFGGRLVTVPISKIKDERKLKDPYDKSSILFALHHIRSGHRISPPVVEKVGPGDFRIVDGSHRLRALKKAGIKKVRVEVT